MLLNIHEGLWVLHNPISIFGVHLSQNMTIVRKSNGKLIVISPLFPDDDWLKEIQKLGEPFAVISPSILNHRNAKRFCELFPKAILYFAPLSDRSDPIIFANVYNKRPLCALNSKIDLQDDFVLIPICGAPLLGEWALYHKSSQNLLVGNMLNLISNDVGIFARLFWRFLGLTAGKPGQSRLFKLAIKDYESYARSIAQLSKLKIEAIIPSQNEIITQPPAMLFQSLIETPNDNLGKGLPENSSQEKLYSKNQRQHFPKPLPAFEKQQLLDQEHCQRIQ